MSTADGTVLPKPGVPKTLGILNVIFGVLLILLGLCTVGSLALGPALFGGLEKIAKQAQAKVQEQQKAQVKELDTRIEAAKTEEEKKQLEAEKASVVANQPQVTVDISDVTNTLRDPVILGVSYAEALSGLVLHIALLISGIGLIRLTGWGRSPGLWWSGLQIVQVLAAMIVTIVYVLPIQRVMSEKMIAKIEEQVAKNGGGPADASAANLSKVMLALAVPMQVGKSLVGCVYPVVLMILLNTAGARAACLAKKDESLEDF